MHSKLKKIKLALYRLKRLAIVSRISIPSILVILIVYISNGCHSNEKHETTENNRFLVTNPLKKDTFTIKEYVCQIHSIQHIELRALERGYLEKIYVDEGQQVKKGQLMFQIMPILYQAELQKAQAEANFADIEYQNTKSLADSNIVSKNELALSKAKLDKAKAELTLAQVHLSFTQIKAPFDGIMDRFNVRLGSLVDEGDLLTSLSDNSEMWVYFNVPEAEYLDYKTNMSNENMLKVNLLMANNKIFDYSGKVETIEAEFNNKTGNIAFRATFPNPKRLLRHGETGNILITVPIINALIIPQKSSFEVLDKKYVFVVDKENIVSSREVVIGYELPHLYAITHGLKPSDKIILEGLRKIKENEKIEFNFIKPENAMVNLDLYAE